MAIFIPALHKNEKINYFFPFHEGNRESSLRGYNGQILRSEGISILFLISNFLKGNSSEEISCIPIFADNKEGALRHMYWKK